MKPQSPRVVLLDRGPLIISAVFILTLAIAAPALAEYLGPDRVTSEFKLVHVPEKDVWTLTHVDPYDGYSDVCLIIHTCAEHPSVGRQQALCGWVADNSGCDEWWVEKEVTVTLPEATISGDLQNCNVSSGWCTTSPTLRLTANEPLDGESIMLIEGTRNGEPFACESDLCDVPLLEGENDFSYWALSTWGDSSQMGNMTAQVDTVAPSSAFANPPEGSSVWVSGVLDLAGSSSDAHSGVVGADLSLDGGATWMPLSLGAGGGWGYSWDTSEVPDGTYQVLARASDLAGHLESTARITVHVDGTSPTVKIPDAWYIWEPLDIRYDDSGIGVESVRLTIDGGEYGDRTYKWKPGFVPDDFIWDRYFGDIVAPIGEYDVTVKVTDDLGNKASASGKILIPAPDPTETPEPTSTPVEELALASERPTSEPTEIGGGLIVVSTPTAPSPPAGAGSLGQSATPLTSYDSISVPSGTSDDGAGGLLWGAAALAAASSATAYALNRRKQRQEYIERKRREIAERSSPAAFADHLKSLRQAAEARVAPIRAAIIGAAAGAIAAAAETASSALDTYVELRNRLGEPNHEPSEGRQDNASEDTVEDSRDIIQASSDTYTGAEQRLGLEIKDTLQHDPPLAEHAVPESEPSFLKRFWNELVSPEGLLDAMTDERVTDAARSVRRLPNIHIPLPIIRGFGYDNLFGRPLTWIVDNASLVRGAGHVLGDASVPLLLVLGEGLTIAPNLINNVRNGEPASRVISDVILDTVGFGLGELGGWLVGLPTAILHPAAGITAKLVADAYASARWAELVDEQGWREALSSGIDAQAQNAAEAYDNAIQQDREDELRPPTPPSQTEPTATPSARSESPEGTDQEPGRTPSEESTPPPPEPESPSPEPVQTPEP